MSSIPPGQEIFQELGPVPEKPADPPHSMILVVEDEDFVREVTCEVLLSAGYWVLRARSATEAVRLFTGVGVKVQLLLTDIVLPGRSGQVLARELRAISPGLRTIFISGYPQNQMNQQEIHERDTYYLPKPFSVEMLMERVKTALGEPWLAPSEGSTAKRIWNNV